MTTGNVFGILIKRLGKNGVRTTEKVPKSMKKVVDMGAMVW